jgi:FixJ family two-component response regulator
MPGMSGHEVQAHMERAGLHVPVVIITGHETPGARERTLRAGASGFLRKPVDDSDLIAAIQTAIDASRAPQGARAE